MNPSTLDEEKILKKFYQTKNNLHQSVCKAVANSPNSERAIEIIMEKIIILENEQRNLLEEIMSGEVDLEKDGQKQVYNALVSSLQDCTPLEKTKIEVLLRALYIRATYQKIREKCKEVIAFDTAFH